MSQERQPALPVNLSDAAMVIAQTTVKEAPDTPRNDILLSELESGAPELTKEEIYRLMGYLVDDASISANDSKQAIKELYNELDQYEGGD